MELRVRELRHALHFKPDGRAETGEIESEKTAR